MITPRTNTKDGSPDDSATSLWIGDEVSMPKTQVQAVLASLGDAIIRGSPEKVLYVSVKIDRGLEDRARRFLAENPGISLVWFEKSRRRYLLFFHEEETYFLAKFNDPTRAVFLFNEVMDYSSLVEYGVLDRSWSDTILFALKSGYTPSFSAYECFLQQRDHFCYGMDCTATLYTDVCPEWMGYGPGIPEELKNIINNRRNLTCSG